jgi:hypothetical protein
MSMGRSQGPCSFPGCENRMNARGLCNSHLCQLYDGRPLAQLCYRPRGSAEFRFWRKVNKNGPLPEARPELGPCWLWIGAVQQGGGYGMFWNPEGMVRAHKWSSNTGVVPALSPVAPSRHGGQPTSPRR